MEIVRNDIGRYELLNEDGERVRNRYTGTDFLKIEKVKEGSVCYCLWPNDKCFYLYNSSCGKFIGVGNGDCWSYSKIQHYSEKTKTFAAYRSDNDNVHLIYEDGTFVRDTFLEIGPESKDDCCSRPVKYTFNGIRWCFYETKNKRFSWSKEKGYKLSEDWSLAERYHNGYCSYINENGLYELLFYDRDVSKLHFFNPYESQRYWLKSIVSEDVFLIAESKFGFYYIFDTSKYNKYPLCSSTDKPYWSNGRLVISNGENWQLFIRVNPDDYGTEVVENSEWKTEYKLIVKGEYVFSQNGDNNSWKIYNSKTGHEIYTEWKNIQVIENMETKTINLVVDTPSVLKLERSVNNIEEERKRWLSKLLKIDTKPISLISSTHVEQQEDKSKVEELVAKTENDKEEIHNIQIEKTEKSCSNSIAKEQTLPTTINYIISVGKVKLLGASKRNIDSNRKCSFLKKMSNILWYARDDRTIYVTFYKGRMTYEIRYELKLENSLYCAELIPNKFTEICLTGVSADNLVDKLNDYFAKVRVDAPELKIDKISRFLQELNIDTGCIEKVVKILTEELKGKQVFDKTASQCRFVFRGKEYSLQKDDVWDIGDPFTHKKFLENEIIAILIDDNFIKTSKTDDVDYEMIGQGKDQRFDQDFERTSVNRNIRDNSKRVLLFERRGDKISFFDEVESVGYRFFPDINSVLQRKLIRFFLKSLIRKT